MYLNLHVHLQFKQAKTWVRDFLSLGRHEGYQKRHVTPYMHAVVYHVPSMIRQHGNLLMFSGQGTCTCTQCSLGEGICSFLQEWRKTMTWPRRTFTPPTAMTHVLKSSCVSRDLRLYRSVEDRREPTTREMKHTGAQASSASVVELNEVFQPYLFKRFFSKPPQVQRMHLH